MDRIGARAVADARRSGAVARLVAALAMVVGWEAMVVQRDVCGFSVAEGEQLSVWAAQAFLQATLQELRPNRPSGQPPRSGSGRMA